jgi:MOSC domain-containing protein
VTDETIAVGAPPGTFFDFSAVHIVTTATLRTLSRAYPQGRFDWRRFRANIIAELDAEGFAENDWVGRRILVGDELMLEVLIPCPRCVMTTLSQGDLPLDSGILRTAAQRNTVMIAPLGQAMPSVGVYAKVLTGGVVRRGDQVRVVS